MSAATYTIKGLMCDADECDETIEGHPGMTLADVVYEARREGWTHKGRPIHVDLCPAHAPTESNN